MPDPGRLGFYLESDTGKGYIELKSVNLVDSQGIARFPNAPTKRGSEHLGELVKLKEKAFHCWLFFMEARKDALIFRPFYERDNTLFNALLKAQNKGANIKALKFDMGVERHYISEKSKQKIRRANSPAFGRGSLVHFIAPFPEPWAVNSPI